MLFCPASVIKRLVETVHDLVFGEIAVSDAVKRNLRHHRARIHRMLRAERSETVKRRFLAQKSSIKALTAVLNAALPFLSDDDDDDDAAEGNERESSSAQ